MAKDKTEAIREFEKELAGLKERVASMEARLAELAKVPEETVPDQVDVDIDIVGIPDSPAAQVRERAAFGLEIARPSASQDQEPAPKAEPAPVPVYPWMKGAPAMRVKNIRSAISLFDRALFINTLFKEDYALYDGTVSDLNAMESIDEAVPYIEEHFPGWDLSSDIVTSFMKAVRKKLG